MFNFGLNYSVHHPFRTTHTDTPCQRCTIERCVWLTIRCSTKCRPSKILRTRQRSSFALPKKKKEPCGRHSAEAKRPHALLLHCLRSHMLTSLSRPTCHFAWHADPPCLVVPDDHKKSKRTAASLCIGPECPSSPIRRPKKKPMSSVWMTVDQPRQSNDVRKNPKRHPPLHYTMAHRLPTHPHTPTFREIHVGEPPTTQPLTPLQKCPWCDPSTTFCLIFSLHRTCKRALMCCGLFWGRGNLAVEQRRCHSSMPR